MYDLRIGSSSHGCTRKQLARSGRSTPALLVSHPAGDWGMVIIGKEQGSVKLQGKRGNRGAKTAGDLQRLPTPGARPRQAEGTGLR